MFMINPPFRGLKRSACNISIAGIKNASVFPEPVFAAPRTSLPVNSAGIPRRCISVIFVKPIVSNAFIVLSDRFSSANFCGSAPGNETSPPDGKSDVVESAGR